ncbi:MAG: hypothetical protein JW955_00070 [Sedimentisphaerales bacterium]|nr:hypothetical protein [Sedimentisphaerales bacterium]
MTLEAPYSKHNKTNFKIYIALCLGAAVIFAYDGYLSKYPWSLRRKFHEEHTKVILFRTGADLQQDLDRGLVSQELRRQFGEARAPLSDAAVASVQQAGSRWAIADQAKKYSLAKEQDGLAIYREGPDETMLFNQISPFFFVVGAAIFGFMLWRRKDVKVVADENELVVAGKERIPYDSIERIDKTYLEKRGFFTIVYKKANGREVHRKLSDRDYDNLAPIVDHLIAKIS